MMFKAINILFGEMMEISIVTSIIYASSKYLLKRNYYFLLGITFGIIISLLFSFAFSYLSSFSEGSLQDLGTIIVSILSIIMIFIMMTRYKYHLKYFKNDLENIHSVKDKETSILLTIIVASGLIRECTEINLFFRAMITSNNTTTLLTGAVIGVILGILAGFLFYRLFIWMFNKNLLTASSWLLMFVAASSATSIPDLLTSTHLISFSNQSLWNSHELLSEKSLFGGIAKNIFGYKYNPTLVHFVSYLSVLSIGLMINLNIIRAKDKN